MANRKLSFTFVVLRKIGFNYSEQEYGQITIFSVFKQVLLNAFRKLLQNMMDWALLEPINPRWLRPLILRGLGCKVGKGVFVGDHVIVDLSHADLITIEDFVHIASGSRLLCHQRDLSDYHKGDHYSDLGYHYSPIYLSKGCLIGMECLILPGVKIGSGAIIGAGSLVNSDIPEWTIAIGRPARVVKTLTERDKNENSDY